MWRASERSVMARIMSALRGRAARPRSRLGSASAASEYRVSSLAGAAARSVEPGRGHRPPGCPLTQTPCTPTASVVRRGRARGQVVDAPLRPAPDASSDRTAAGRPPSPSRIDAALLRGRAPRPDATSAAAPPRPVVITPRSRAQWPSRCRPKPASLKNVRCAPASLRLTMLFGWFSIRPTASSSLLSSCAVKTVSQVLGEREVEHRVERVAAVARERSRRVVRCS